MPIIPSRLVSYRSPVHAHLLGVSIRSPPGPAHAMRRRRLMAPICDPVARLSAGGGVPSGMTPSPTNPANPRRRAARREHAHCGRGRRTARGSRPSCGHGREQEAHIHRLVKTHLRRRSERRDGPTLFDNRRHRTKRPMSLRHHPVTPAVTAAAAGTVARRSRPTCRASATRSTSPDARSAARAAPSANSLGVEVSER